MAAPFSPVFDYTASPTLWRVANDNTRTRIIIGPVGSGKSTLCCNEIVRRALEQEPSPWDNVRYFKAAVVRNTYTDLKMTTLKTWADVFPPDIFGEVSQGSPMTFHFRKAPAGPVRGRDEPGLDLIVEFFPLDRPADIKRLLSYECSMVWANELRELPAGLWRVLNQRIGRYPSRRNQGVDCTWAGRVADSNAAEDGHWMEEIAKRPRERRLVVFRQPPALMTLDKFRERYGFSPAKEELVTALTGERWAVNPGAENLANLRKDYYTDSFDGDTKASIRVFGECKPGFVADGKPVVESYDDVGQTRVNLPILPDRPILAGIDIGGGTLMPAAVLGQRHDRGVWLIHAEIVGDGIGVELFAPLILQKVAERYGPRAKIHVAYRDPAADARDEIFAVAVGEHLRSRGIPNQAAPTQEIDARIAAIVQPCQRTIEGVPGLLVDEQCVMIRAGLSGRWYYKRLAVVGEERHSERPVKNRYSHPCEGLGYLLCGGGEYRKTQGRSDGEGHGNVVATSAINRRNRAA